MYLRIIAVWFLAVFASSCFAAQPWYPKGSEQCGQYVAEATNKNGRTLTTPTKDPAIRKLVDDFNSASGVRDKGGMALLYLLAYCNTHASTRLRDVSASDLVNLANEGKFKDQLDQWFQQAVAACGSQAQCVGVVTSYRDNALACNSGNQQACTDQQRDLANLNQYRATGGGTPAPSDNSLQACLQNTARVATQYCAAHNQCDGAVIETIKTMQEAQCGYSAIKVPEPTPAAVSHCTTSPTGGGGWTSDCTQQ